jgi:hypothetical protein
MQQAADWSHTYASQADLAGREVMYEVKVKCRYMLVAQDVHDMLAWGANILNAQHPVPTWQRLSVQLTP